MRVKRPFRGTICSHSKRWRLSSTVRGALWLLEELSTRDKFPEWMTLDDASRALGFTSVIIRERLEKGRIAETDGKFLRIEGRRVWVPSLVEQVRWVSETDAGRFLGVTKDRIWGWAQAGRLERVPRAYRARMCVDLEAFLRVVWWRKVCKLTHHKFGWDMAQVLLEFPVEVALDFIRLYRQHGWAHQPGRYEEVKRSIEKRKAREKTEAEGNDGD